MTTPIIRVEDVSKRFNIHKDKSLKERVVNAGRSRASTPRSSGRSRTSRSSSRRARRSA